MEGTQCSSDTTTHTATTDTTKTNQSFEQIFLKYIKGETPESNDKTNKLKCKICYKIFSYKSNLKVHLDTHSAEKKNQCPTCHKFFSTKHSLIYHMKLHTQTKEFHCEHCKKSFLTKKSLLTHMEITHKKIEIKQFHCCTQCNKRFLKKGYLSRHMKRHERVKNYKCPMCGMMFGNNFNLSVHLKRHKDVECTICYQRFSDTTSLNLHLKLHNGVKDSTQLKPTNKVIISPHNSKPTLSENIVQNQTDNTETEQSFEVIYIKNEPHEIYLSDCEVKIENENEITIKEEFVNHSNQDRQIYESLLQESQEISFDSNSSTSAAQQTETTQCGTQQQPDNKVIILSLQNSNTTLSEKNVQKQTDNTETEHSFKDIYIKNEPHETYLSDCEVKMENENEITIKEEFVNHSNQDRQIYESLLQETSQESDRTIWKDSSSNEKTLQNLLCCPVCSKTFTTEHELRFHVNKHEELNFDSNSSPSTAHQTETTQYGKIKTELDVACTRNQLQTDNEDLCPQNSNTTLSENTETHYNFKDIYVKKEPCEEYLSHCEVKMEDENEIAIKEEFVNHSNQDRQIYESLLQETQDINFDSTSSTSTAHQTETTQYDVACTRNQLQTGGTTSGVELHNNINSNQLQLQSEETVATYFVNKLEQMIKDKHSFVDGILIKCPFCDEFSQFSPEMKQHIRSHIGTTENYCTKCERSFIKKFTFKYHMSSHLSIIEIYKCPLCPKSYTNRDSLRRHMRLQDSEHLEAFRAECLKN